MDKNAKIAVIGAGVAGLVNAKWLKQYGYNNITIFEQSDDVGGMWNAKNNNTQVWERLHLNTPRYGNAFSDFPPTYKAMYPSWQEHHDYLRAFAEHFKLIDHCRFNTLVTNMSQINDNKWKVTINTPEELEFDYVVVATGRFSKRGERKWTVPGLDTFDGEVEYASNVWNFSKFENKRVLVVGGNISALEIAANLVHHAAGRVNIAVRTPRLLLEKWMNGKPMELQLFARFPGLLMQVLPPNVVMEGLRQIIHQNFGDAVDFGGLPREQILITLCQGYLHHVGEGAIVEQPDVARVEGKTVHFVDGTSVEVDVILSSIGYDHYLPFFDQPTLDALHDGGNTGQFLDLVNFTFNPKLKNFALAGYLYQEGANAWTWELQARYITYIIAGVLPPLSDEQMAQGLAACRGMRGMLPSTNSAMIAHIFAELIGCNPPMGKYPDLANVLMFKGCMTPYEYRLVGPDADEDKYLPEFRRVANYMFSGNVPKVPSPEDLGGLKMCAEKLGAPPLQQLVTLFESLATTAADEQKDKQ